MIKRINSALPTDIMILGYSKVGPDFSARHNCKSRTYRYFIFRENLNLEKMQEGAKLFIGSHDFKRFCKMQPQYEKTGTVRSVLETKVYAINNDYDDVLPMICFECRGSAFLWHQVKL